MISKKNISILIAKEIVYQDCIDMLMSITEAKKYSKNPIMYKYYLRNCNIAIETLLKYNIIK